ncbi:hypothetical protein AWZ03_015345, partial [Drosophila navojoa]
MTNRNTSNQTQNATHSALQNGNSYKIAFWNASGVSNKINEVELFIQRLKIDIMMVVETRVTPGTTTLDVPGYVTYTATNQQSHRRGGVAILVRNSIRHMALQPI